MFMTRRGLLRGAVMGGVLVATSGPQAPARAVPLTASPPPSLPRSAQLSGARSPNGWLVSTAADRGEGVWTRPCGPAVSFAVAMGDAEVVLRHVVERFSREIAPLGSDDVVGFRPVRGLRGSERNHASGTAVDVLPGRFPPGVAGGMFPLELQVVRDILGECDGVVRWGGDSPSPAEAHWQIDVPPSDRRLMRLADSLRKRRELPGGVGVLEDTAAGVRRVAASAVHERQCGEESRKGEEA